MDRQTDQRRRIVARRIALGLLGACALVFLAQTGEFLVTRKLVRDTLLSLGLGAPIEDALVTVDSCTTTGRAPRRGGMFVLRETDCDVTIRVPATAPHRRIERAQVRLRDQRDGETVLGAGELLGRLGARWPGATLARLWLEVPNIFFVIALGPLGLIYLAVWRWRRWRRHDRFRRRRRF